MVDFARLLSSHHHRHPLHHHSHSATFNNPVRSPSPLLRDVGSTTNPPACAEPTQSNPPLPFQKGCGQAHARSMEEPGSKKGEGSERVMRGCNDNREREDEEEEEGTTMPVRRENGPQRMLWPCSFCPFPRSPLTTLNPTQHPPPA